MIKIQALPEQRGPSDYPSRQGVPFCVTGYAGQVFFIPTLILLSLARLLFYNRDKRTTSSLSKENHTITNL